MKVIYHPNAEKVLARLPAHDRDMIKTKLRLFAETGQGDVRKLTARDEYRIRIGVWRALFVIQDGVLVLKVAHRREVYR